jgi:hypothetical protein
LIIVLVHIIQHRVLPGFLACLQEESKPDAVATAYTKIALFISTLCKPSKDLCLGQQQKEKQSE